MRYLKDDLPHLWEKLKNHSLEMPDDWEGEYSLYCKKCGKKAIQKMNLLWICPELYDIPDEYFHSG